MPSESEEETEPEEERPNETSPIMEFGGPNVPAPVTKTAELKLNQPKPFTGKRNEIEDFIQDVALYLEINDEIYNTDKKKIGYTLTFMNEGDAKSWKAQYIRNAGVVASATSPVSHDLSRDLLRDITIDRHVRRHTPIIISPWHAFVVLSAD